MKKIRNLSIRKTIIFYMFLTLVLSYLLGYAVIRGAERTQLKIWEKYMGEAYFRQIEGFGITENMGGIQEEVPERLSEEKMSQDLLQEEAPGSLPEEISQDLLQEEAPGSLSEERMSQDLLQEEAPGSLPEEISQDLSQEESPRSLSEEELPQNLPQEELPPSLSQEELPPSPPEVHRINAQEMTSRDRALSEACDFLQTYSILVISCVGTVVAVFVFYRNKLKVPFAQLTKASAAIADNNLDFTISYSNQDEMGQLCQEFETMRRQLAENNSRMWKMVEQEKALRASVAHDIRSPLAVLKGYQEMMLELVPGGTLELENEMEMLEEGQKQIQRMENFLNRMKSLSSLEQREIRRREVFLPKLAEQYRRNMEILAEGSGKKCELRLKEGKETAKIDVDIVTEVLENLLTNALRYATETVDIILEADNGEFRIEVWDDGVGFTESEEVLTSIYYHDNPEDYHTSLLDYHANPEDDLTHFGMGLYICRIYCEKHGGRLLLGNQEKTGGKAIAIFAEEDGEDRAGW